MPFERLVISSGHGLYVRGASGILDEVDEARKVVNDVAQKLKERGVEVVTFHDDISHSQNENLNRIVDYHNKQKRELDVSTHFNAYVETSKAMGVEVLYVTQQQLAAELSVAIANAIGLPNRGAKKRTDLFFLNQTDQPAVLIETCFVDSTVDASAYNSNFDKVCSAVADVLGGTDATAPAPEPPPTEAVAARIDITIAVEGDAVVTINGETVDVASYAR